MIHNRLSLMMRRYWLWMAIGLSPAAGAIAQNPDTALLAEEYAGCAAYYLMMSKADDKLQKLAPVGIAAADTAGRFVDQDKVLMMMGEATRDMLAAMDNDWGNAGVVIEQKADFCKALMTRAE